MKTASDYATPIILGLLYTPVEKVKTSKALVDTVKASPGYVPGSDVDLALADFSAETIKLQDANEGVVQADLEAQMARTEQAGCAQRWALRKVSLLTTVRLSCNGSAPLMKALGFGVLDVQDTPLGVVPEGLRRRKHPAAGAAAVTWDVQPGVDTYMVQHATDPADPATYSAPKSSSKVSFTLPGQTPGATIYFRVYALDPRLPAGQTDWCGWFAVKVGV